MTERRLSLLFVLTVLLPAAGLGAVAASAASDEVRLAELQREERRRALGVQVRDGLRERVVARLRAVSERARELAARGDDLRALRDLEPEALALDPGLGLLVPAAPWTGPGALELAAPPPAWLTPILALEARPAELLEALAARTADERALPAALGARSRALRALGRAGEALEADRALVASAATPPTTRWLARERVIGVAAGGDEAARAVDELLGGGGGGLTPGAWWSTLEAACGRLPGDVARLESARPALRLARAAALVAAVGSRALGAGDGPGEPTLLLLRAGPAGGGDGLLALGPPGPVRGGLLLGGDELGRLARDLARAGAGEVEVELVASGPGGAAGEPLGGGLTVVARAIVTEAAAAEARRRLLARSAALAGLVLTIVAGSLLGARALRRSAELARLRGDFVASVTHELRTPVTSIRAMAEVLGQGKLTPERQQEYFQAIALEARRLGRRIEDALAAARLERGAIQPRPEPVDLAAAVAAVVEHARPAADVAGQAIVVDIAPGLPPARVDPGLLEQALENLLDNALKHGTPREGSPGQVRVVVRAVGGQLQLAVEDQGAGIAPAERARVLEPFFRGKTSAGTPGAGLGLAIVRSIAEAHGGSVLVAAAPGGGAAVSLRLPAWPVFTSEEEGR